MLAKTTKIMSHPVFMNTYIRDGSSDKAPAASDAPPSGIKSARDVPAAPLAEDGGASKDKSARKAPAGGVSVNDLARLPAGGEEVRRPRPSLFFFEVPWVPAKLGDEV